MDKYLFKINQFIRNAEIKYGKKVPNNENKIEFISKKVDLQKVKGFTWNNVIGAWGVCEADLLKIKPKETGSLRVLWYRNVKQFFQNIMKDEVDLDKANALLSSGLVNLVKTGKYLYEDFSVEDFSYSKDFSEFIKSLNVILFVEKASEFPKFIKSCEILGIKILLQGSGRPNFSSTEYIFTHFFNGKVDETHPIRILTLTDFDYDGINPIAGGFVKQMKHYTPYVKVGRIGLESSQIAKNRLSVNDALYEVKQDHQNKPKKEWMEKNLFKSPTNRYLGAEIECNSFKFYYPLIWDALKKTDVTYQMYLDKRYQNIQPDVQAVTKEIAIKLLANNLKEIDKQIKELNTQRNDMISEKMNELKPKAIKIKNDPNFIKFQKPKNESSIYEALKYQRNWTGGISFTNQRKEFIRRMNNE